MKKLMLTSRGSEIQALRDDVAALTRTVQLLVDELAQRPNSPRDDWQRYTLAEDLADITLLPTRRLPMVKPDLEIKHITIDQFSYVRVYGDNWRELKKYWGQLGSVIHTLQMKAPHIQKWQSIQVRESGPVAGDRETPIPDAHPALV